MQINYKVTLAALLLNACGVQAMQSSTKKRTRPSDERPALQADDKYGKIEQRAQNKLYQRRSKREKKAYNKSDRSFKDHSQ